MTLSYLVLDTGTEFIAISEQEKLTSFEYGQFSLSVCNTDYENNERRINEYIYKHQDIKEAIVHCISSVYLNWEQVNYIADMITEEIVVNSDMNSVVTIPEIYTNKELHHHIRKMLQRDSQAFESNIQDELSTVILNQSVIMFEGVPMTGYYFNSIKDFMIIDIQRFLLSGHLVKECERCKCLFIPSRKSDKYCKLLNMERLSCGELAHRNRNKTEFERLREKARGMQSYSLRNDSTVKKYDVTILSQMYDDWSIECAKQYKKYKAKDDIEGFTLWIEKTKYTALRIEKEYKKRVRQKNIAEG